MKTIVLGIGEPFSSPAWGSNFILFSSGTGEPIPEPEVKAYLARACRYARHFGVYLVPERFMMPDRHCMCLISPDGKVMGAQQALYRNLDHTHGQQGTEIEVISTEFGGIFLCVDVDIYRPQLIRLAHNMGASIVLSSQQIADMDYGTNMVVSGVWNAAQSNNIYTVGVSNKFHCVCAPRLLTKQGDGFLISPTLKIPSTAKLEAERLSSLPRKPMLGRRFFALHRQELLDE